MKKLISTLIAAAMLTAGAGVFAESVDIMGTITPLHREFAMQYDYDESDLEYITEHYGDLLARVGGPAKRPDGTLYEEQGFYDDNMALFFDSYDLQSSGVNILVNGQSSEYGKSAFIYNDNTLVPGGIFTQLGVDTAYNEGLMLTTYVSGDTVIEIQPYMLTMRKNREDGYWVPLRTCSRIINGEIYMPLRAIAEELGIGVDWDGTTNTVLLSY